MAEGQDRRLSAAGLKIQPVDVEKNNAVEKNNVVENNNAAPSIT
jgi:hypothetical protein